MKKPTKNQQWLSKLNTSTSAITPPPRYNSAQKTVIQFLTGVATLSIAGGLATLLFLNIENFVIVFSSLIGIVLVALLVTLFGRLVLKVAGHEELTN